ncbi:tetratricopeptide repeat protein [Phenylobacterium deserti]|uniref:Uncharacterized protein n=1 Tax=Phenylobacterium deserti TaxID=1914756 RepID=A0A328AT93_9CAUL|nr:tetratricopeptide repeat protein [Phenylobacterium deserti]RAK57817.1 hypothetical protein DJ018_07840 [Phenylobacterium deserti]
MTDAARDAQFEEAMRLEKAGDAEGAVRILQELAKPALTMKIAQAMGVTLLNAARFDEAERWLGQAARHRPSNVGVRTNLGRVYEGQGRFELAELEYKTALAFEPESTYAKLAFANFLLSGGRYREGWPLMEVRAQEYPDLVPPVTDDFPEWKGQPLAGKSILVWYEQGFGDQIQMCRFARELKARGASRVTLGCRPPLAKLFSTLDAADEIVPVGRDELVAVRGHDYWTRYFSMPAYLGTTLESLWTGPYLGASDDKREKWRGWSGVGLAWRASATGFNAANKSLPPEQARRLFDLGVVSLDPEDTGATDFADTAAIIEQLDLVISIDSAPAHLAGAMGKPVWTLLPFLKLDWRWLRSGDGSPWYPSMRLYRQSKASDWPATIDRVIDDLRAAGHA